MNQAIKEKWIQALNSGEYPQTRGCLKDDNGYCCLGVLSDLYQKETNIFHWENRTDKDGTKYYEMGSETAVLPIEVVEWAGLDSNDPHFYIDGVFGYLSRLNDSGADFPDISNYIAQNF
jgi:hypothetical protein